MINISEKEFQFYKGERVVFPVILQLHGDELTPISIFYSLEGKNKFLLESSSYDKGAGRYSFIGIEPYMSIKSCHDEVSIITDGEIYEHKGRVLDFVKEHLDLKYNSLGLDIPFVGGAVGYVGYDVIKEYEKLPDSNIDEIKIPEAYLMFYRTFICFDHFKHRVFIVYNVLPEDASEYTAVLNKLQVIDRRLKEKNIHHELPRVDKQKEFKSNVTEESFCSLVKRAKKYIHEGDIFQVVLSQRLRFDITSEPFDVYRRLRSKNPSPYLFFIDYEDFQIAGSSPESLVTVFKDRVETNPIAGTKPRGKDDAGDEKLKDELFRDEKERAEHVMLVDLGRNDIGKISEFGSVKVDRFMEVDFYSHVMHLVSKVSGKLKRGLNCFDALQACLPVGTVSGAPKIRAMEIIDELEDVKRGLYAGAVGYFSYDGNMDTCIAIRTIIFKDKYAYVQAGAGIVQDSDPKSEYIETLNKAMAMKEVL
jgi:anthranilate synthase component I